jgi:hypothetical protein
MSTNAPRPPWTPPRTARIIAVAVAFVAVNIGDALFTLYLLHHGYREVNPVMLWLLSKGVWAFVGVKTVVPALIAARLAQATASGHRMAWYCLGLSTLAYSALCLIYAFVHCSHTNACF